jgi:hypothetical protein
VQCRGSALKIAVCGICRNEVSYVEEWVAYYKVLGFDSVYIYDNVSDDGTSELLSALHSIGEITRTHWPRREGIPPQRDAYGHFLECFSNNYDYVLICDLDEFLVVDKGTVKDLLLEAESKFDNVGAIAFPWRIFGSSGQEVLTKDLVIERFKKCEKRASTVVKTMFSPKNTYNMRTHICDLLSGVYLDNSLAVAEWNQQMPIKLKSSTFGRAVVHHYYTKSREEWTKRRSLPKADRSSLELKDVAEFDKYHNQMHESFGATVHAPAVIKYLGEIRGKLRLVRQQVGAARLEIISINKDWVFGVVHGVNSNSILQVRILTSQHKETIVDTKPIDNSTHLFIVKTKWRDTFSEMFSMSIVGSEHSQVFSRMDWPSAEKSIEMMVEFCPEAEEHIFSTFINLLAKEPDPTIIKLMNGLEFAKNTKFKGFVEALTGHIEEPTKGYLQTFISTCADDFKKQIADPGNKRRKFVVDAIKRSAWGF